MLARVGIFVRWLYNLVNQMLGRPGRVQQTVVAVEFVVSWRRNGRAKALFAHRARPLLWSEKDPRFLGHSIDWEAKELATGMHARGYDLVALSGWSPLMSGVDPGSGFSAILDENANLPRFAPHLLEGARKLLYLTGSYPRFMNEAENRRCRDLNERRGVAYAPKRQLREVQFDAALELCDRALIVGNAVTVGTYPLKFREKLWPISVSASVYAAKAAGRLAPKEREFLWFFGEGAVHKGLDLLLEVFARRTNWILNVVGSVGTERDFVGIFRRELLETPNIRYHGFLNASSREFRQLVDRCFAFVAPTCSEGISPAAVTCMGIGLLPIISRNTGVDLPDNVGRYLETCSLSEIEQALEDVLSLTDVEVARQVAAAMEFAQTTYSRERYSTMAAAFFAANLPEVVQ